MDENLDAMTGDELVIFIRDLRILLAYAEHKGIAIEYRLDGDIRKAIEQEARCERYYNKLPAKFRW